MGIDGIGKPGAAGVPPPVATEAQPGFAVGKSEATDQTAGAAGTEALGRLQRGEIGLDEYLDAQVEAATAHLRTLPAEQLDFIRQSLRAELGSDPVLVELVRRTTGASPVDLNR
jgi:hypothetical protein